MQRSMNQSLNHMVREIDSDNEDAFDPEGFMKQMAPT